MKQSILLATSALLLSSPELVAQNTLPGIPDVPVLEPQPAAPAVPQPATPVVPQPATPVAPNSANDPAEPLQPVDPEGNKLPDKVPNKIPKAIIVEDEPFIPVGGIAQLKEQADIDLFTKGKQIGHVQNNPELKFRRLVQRTIMPTEPISKAGAVLTFDDYLVADSSKTGSAIDIVKDLAPLNTRAIFFANVNGVSGTDVSRILRKRVSDSEKKKLIQSLLAAKKKEFVKTIRALIKVQGPADADGNRQYICEVFNHTAFHQDMSQFKVGAIRFEIALIGIDFIEECLEEAYHAERPGWKRARYFRFPFLHSPKDKAARAVLNKKFTEHGLICVGETQDSKDFVNYSSSTAYRSLAAAKKHRRYNPKYGIYGSAEKPVALFHTKTWKKIKSGVIKAITE